MCAIKDNVLEMQRLAHKELCENEPQPKCEFCQDEGYVTKTEWVGTDTSYDLEVRCICNED